MNCRQLSGNKYKPARCEQFGNICTQRAHSKKCVPTPSYAAQICPNLTTRVKCKQDSGECKWQNDMCVPKIKQTGASSYRRSYEHKNNPYTKQKSSARNSEPYRKRKKLASEMSLEDALNNVENCDDELFCENPKSCTREEAKKAFNHLARLLHPDKNHSRDTTEAMKKLFQCWELLKKTRSWK